MATLLPQGTGKWRKEVIILHAVEGKKSNGVKMGFLEEGKKSWKGGFSKGGTDLFAVKGLVYTTTSVCLSVRPPVHEILNASALPLAAVAAALAKPLRH